MNREEARKVETAQRHLREDHGPAVAQMVVHVVAVTRDMAPARLLANLEEWHGNLHAQGRGHVAREVVAGAKAMHA